MTALSANRNTPQLASPAPAPRRFAVAASAMIFAGAMTMRNAAGYLVPGSTATGLVGAGRAEHLADNTNGAAGDAFLDVAEAVFLYENSTAGDEITIADIGAVCFAVDDQTVAKTDGTATRSPAGTVVDIDDQGVWVRFDPALTKAAAV
ncbi:MAG: hypothetical protein AB7S99_10295 [Pseudodonghicola sp.]